MKILIVCGEYFNQSNGLSISTQRFVKEFVRLGEEVRVLSSDHGGVSDYSVPVMHIPLVDGIMDKQNYHFAKPDANVVDVFAFHGWFLSSFALLPQVASAGCSVLRLELGKNGMKKARCCCIVPSSTGFSCEITFLYAAADCTQRKDLRSMGSQGLPLEAVSGIYPRIYRNVACAVNAVLGKFETIRGH